MTEEEMKLDMLVAELDYENRMLQARNKLLTIENESRSALIEEIGLLKKRHEFLTSENKRLNDQLKGIFAAVDACRLQANPNQLSVRLQNNNELADPCPGCKKGGVCRTSECGRLKLPENHPCRVGN